MRFSAAFALAVCLCCACGSPPAPPQPALKPEARHPNVDGLAALRSAITVYFADHNGKFPSSSEELTRDGKYITPLPSVQLTPHLSTDEFADYPSRTPQDTGRWGYISNPQDREWGSVFVDCTHTDLKGAVWASY